MENLKSIYETELKKVWDDKMVKYLINETALIIEHNGKLYAIDKPKIEKRFCFSYGLNGISNDEEYKDAEKMAEHARKNQEYFITENLKNVNKWLKILKEIQNENTRYKLEIGEKYYRQPENCKLMGYNIYDTWYSFQKYEGKFYADSELVEKFISGYEEVKKLFEKRLHAYLKRYGLSNVKSWSYLLD